MRRRSCGWRARGDYEDCGICLDAAEEVAIDGCDHMLCGARRPRRDSTPHSYCVASWPSLRCDESIGTQLKRASRPAWHDMKVPATSKWMSIIIVLSLDAARAVECAISLCEVHKKPPLCPFCRRGIHGFHHIGTFVDCGSPTGCPRPAARDCKPQMPQS